MNLDVGELRNRLRSRTQDGEPDPKPEPKVVPETEPSTDATDLRESPVVPQKPGKMVNPLMGELHSQFERRKQKQTTENKDAVQQQGQESQPPKPAASPVKPQVNPFLGELNSRLQNRRIGEDGVSKPPSLPAKPKPSPKPSFSPKPALGPKPTQSPTASPISSHLPTFPSPPKNSANVINGTVDTGLNSTTPESKSPNVSPVIIQPSSSPVDVSTPGSKMSFLQDLKRKILSGPPRKSVDEKDKDEGKENVGPVLTHEVAKHRLLVRPKKMHRMSYADYRKSRMHKEPADPLKIISDFDVSIARDTLITRPDVVTSNPASFTSGSPPKTLAPDILTFKLEKNASSAEIVITKNMQIDSPVLPTENQRISKGDSLEKEDPRNYVGSMENLDYSAADTSEEQLFHTPPESPNDTSELGQNESVYTDPMGSNLGSMEFDFGPDSADFVWVSSELTPTGSELKPNIAELTVADDIGPISPKMVSILDDTYPNISDKHSVAGDADLDISKRLLVAAGADFTSLRTSSVADITKVLPAADDADIKISEMLPGADDTDSKISKVLQGSDDSDSKNLKVLPGAEDTNYKNSEMVLAVDNTNSNVPKKNSVARNSDQNTSKLLTYLDEAHRNISEKHSVEGDADLGHSDDAISRSLRTPPVADDADSTSFRTHLVSDNADYNVSKVLECTQDAATRISKMLPGADDPDFKNSKVFPVVNEAEPKISEIFLVVDNTNPNVPKKDSDTKNSDPSISKTLPGEDIPGICKLPAVLEVTNVSATNLKIDQRNSAGLVLPEGEAADSEIGPAISELETVVSKLEAVASKLKPYASVLGPFASILGTVASDIETVVCNLEPMASEQRSFTSQEKYSDSFKPPNHEQAYSNENKLSFEIGNTIQDHTGIETVFTKVGPPKLEAVPSCSEMNKKVLGWSQPDFACAPARPSSKLLQNDHELASSVCSVSKQKPVESSAGSSEYSQLLSTESTSTDPLSFSVPTQSSSDRSSRHSSERTFESDQPSSKTAQGAQPPSKPIQPTFKPVEPTKPAQLTSKLVQPASKLVQPASKPAQPSSKPAQPSSKPAQPSSKPAQPSSKPAQPSSKPVQPASKPSQSTTELKQPVSELAIPLESSRPTSELTRHNTDLPRPTSESVRPISEPDLLVFELAQTTCTSKPAQLTSSTTRPISKPQNSASECDQVFKRPVSPQSEHYQFDTIAGELCSENKNPFPEPGRSSELSPVPHGYEVNLEENAASSAASQKGKNRAAKLKLQHEIELFQKKQFAGLCNTTSMGSEVVGTSEVPIPESHGITQIAATRQESRADSSWDVLKSSVECDSQTTRDVQTVYSPQKKVEETCKMNDKFPEELKKPTTKIEVQSGFITEESDDFVLVEVTKDIPENP